MGIRQKFLTGWTVQTCLHVTLDVQNAHVPCRVWIQPISRFKRVTNCFVRTQPSLGDKGFLLKHPPGIMQAGISMSGAGIVITTSDPLLSRSCKNNGLSCLLCALEIRANFVMRE